MARTRLESSDSGNERQRSTHKSESSHSYLRMICTQADLENERQKLEERQNSEKKEIKALEIIKSEQNSNLSERSTSTNSKSLRNNIESERRDLESKLETRREELEFRKKALENLTRPKSVLPQSPEVVSRFQMLLREKLVKHEEADRLLSLPQVIQITTTNLSHIKEYYKKYSDIIREISAEGFFEKFSFSENYNAFDTAHRKAQKVLKEVQKALNAEQGSAQVIRQYQRELATCNQDLSRAFEQINPCIKLEHAGLAVDRLDVLKYKGLLRIIQESGDSHQPYESYQTCYQRCEQVVEAVQSNSYEARYLTQSFQELKSSYQDLLCSFQEFRDYVDTQLLGFTKMSTFCTDDGKEVISRHWASMGLYDKMTSLQSSAACIEEKRLQGKYRFLELPDISYNCHSFTFTNGRGGWIQNQSGGEVEKILKKQRFTCVYKRSDFLKDHSLYHQFANRFDEKKNNYIVLYLHSSEGIIHSSPIGNVDAKEGRIELFGKWGWGSLGTHEINEVLPEYYFNEDGPCWEIWFTDREGGRLLNEQAQSDSADLDDLTIINISQ